MTTETTKCNSKEKKVLIVDDEPDVNTVLKNVFDQNGFNAASYDDPILALENFKAGSYDLLLLDIKMPEMEWFSVVSKDEKDRQQCQSMFFNSQRVVS